MDVHINNVSFQYGKEEQTLTDINLEFKSGECILLCGESGCGKTTVTKLVNGLIPHFEENGVLVGKTTVGDFSVADTEMYKLSECIGSVFQNPKSQFFNTDSDSEIVFGLENIGVEPEAIKERFDATVSALHIDYLLGKSIFALSGGEKQILAFASVYAMNPSVFVLDEPTANLDAEAINLLREKIQLAKDEGRTVIIAEHRLYFLMDLIDRAVFIRAGKVECIFSRKELLALTEEERISYGLRSLKQPMLEITEAESVSGTGLTIENLTCAYKSNTVFSNRSFSAESGAVLGIVGRNGAGKTTLTRCICGLHKEKKGRILLEGKPLKLKQRQKACFCVMQDVNHQLFADSVENECLLSAPNASDAEIDEVLRAFDLLDFKQRHPMALSGGQKQRLAVATAVLSDKQVMLFDEPTSGLDFHRMIEVGEMIQKLKTRNKIILVVSHDFEFLNLICDTVYTLEK